MAVVTQFQFRRGTAAQWTSTNPTLASGEFGYETDTGKAKIGNGTTAWNSLSYAITGSAGTVTSITAGTGLSGGTITSSGTIAIDSTVVTLTGSQTLTNKTLTTPVISSISNTGTLTLPISTDTLVGRATTDTLTNKTINGSNNTISNVSLTTGVTGTLPAANGGTGITALGTGISTWLGTPSSANLAAAVTDETGSGALVFGTSPAIDTPTLTLSSSTSTTNGRIAWVQASDKIVVGDGTAAVEFAPSTILTNAQTGTSYTLVLGDKDRLVELSNAAAISLTVPTNASVAFPIGSTITLLQTGAGQVTVGGAGVTINGTPGLKLRTQWSSGTLIKRGTDTWVLLGDLSA